MRTLYGAGLIAVMILIDAGTGAWARGGGSSIMNSPGYQRRLQESRGYVTDQSGSLLSPAPAPASKIHIHKRRHRH